MVKDGKKLEVDHFNPKLTGKKRNFHKNLFPATRHSNRIKSDTWPSASDQKLGLRFLNCCEEIDYGEHIFEDPVTHRVFGITPSGRYHVRYCDLNDDLYIQERRNRSEIRKLLDQTPAKIKHPTACMKLYAKLNEICDGMIPFIPLRREGELPLGGK
ncbi:MAG: hypothetical protein AAGH72_06195 [Verrucomicrobiota bacterium]